MHAQTHGTKRSAFALDKRTGGLHKATSADDNNLSVGTRIDYAFCQWQEAVLEIVDLANEHASFDELMSAIDAERPSCLVFGRPRPNRAGL